jgi:hypothetical protein
MSHDEPQEGRRPEEDIEIFEIDVTPYLKPEHRTLPIREGQRPEEDFAIEESVPLPALVLMVDLRQTNGTPEIERLAAAVASASECEAGFGGSGLDERDRRTRDGLMTLTLVPRTLEGARERLMRVARIAAGFAGTKTAYAI